jgi:hypothetical protein
LRECGHRRGKRDEGSGQGEADSIGRVTHDRLPPSGNGSRFDQ